MGLGSAVFLVLALIPERNSIVQAAASFHWGWFPAALALALVNYGIRAIRWQWYLGQLGISVPLKESLSIFLIGLMLSVTPGKAGELFKAYLIKLSRGVPMSRTAPVVVVERVTDLTGTLVLVTVSLLAVRVRTWMVVTLWVLLTAAILLATNRYLMQTLIRGLKRVVPSSLAATLERTYESLNQLLSPKCLLGGTFLSAVAWFAECISLWVVVRGFGWEISWTQATFIYTLATLAGAALFFMPGGIGGTEAAMTALLREIGNTPLAVASLATVLTRVSTLWFAAAIGSAALFFYPLPATDEVDAEMDHECQAG
jgi:uncharacterized protein (TIRG00374 family)